MTSPRINVKPATLRWACERSRIDPTLLARRFKRLSAWESGEKKPTLKQLEAFAKATHTAIGYYFGPGPPKEPVSITDFRTIANTPVGKPSGDLLDTVYLCQRRQDWYQEFMRQEGEPPLPFVGSATLADPTEEVAADIRETLGFGLEQRQLATWTGALHCFTDRADAAGILVMVSGVVGNNNRRKLDPAEFRGFALADPFAPVVFVNGADSKAAQMFTFAHELAHIWLGETGLSDSEVREVPSHRTERWCSEVAADLLVPFAALRKEHRSGAEMHCELRRLARHFKVCTLVVLRRMRDAGLLRPDECQAAYEEQLARPHEPAKGGGSSSFYSTVSTRASKRFAIAILAKTFAGESSYTDMFRLLGVRRLESLRRLGHSLGLPIMREAPP